MDRVLHYWPQKLNQRHVLAICPVLVLHALIALMFLSTLTRSPLIERPSEIYLTLNAVASQLRQQRPQIVEPSLPVIEPPEIAIERDDIVHGATSAPAWMVLGPRPDPLHPNPPPELSIRENSTALRPVLLKILVRPDGMVSQTVVVQSSGESQADKLIAEFVEANWRFLPSTLAGTPIQYWTLVSIPVPEGKE